MSEYNTSQNKLKKMWDESINNKNNIDKIKRTSISFESINFNKLIYRQRLFTDEVLVDSGGGPVG